MDVLSKKQYKSYKKLSRYGSFPVYYNKLDNKYVYGTTMQLKNDTPYTLYKCKNSDTFDDIALKFYNNPTYYWVICDFNRIQDPFMELNDSIILKIPSLTLIQFKSGE